MNIDALIIISTSIVNLLLGCLILFRNPRSPINRLFSYFSLSLVVWTIFNYLADQASVGNLLYTRLAFSSAALISVAIYEISNIFPTGKSLNGNKLRVTEWILTAVMVVISVTSLIVPSVTKVEGGVELEVGVLYPLYTLYIVHLLVVVIFNFRRRHKQSSVLEKSQINFLLAGIVMYAIFAMASNLILPLIVDNWSSSRFGPLATLLLVAMMAYAMIRHRLLDIRLIVARSIAYILLLVTLIGLYGVIVFGVTESLFRGSEFSLRVVPVLTALLLAFTTPYLKSLFNRFTNKFFYRDAYDPQAFLNEFNKVLVTTIDLDVLLKSATTIIESNLKAEFCAIGIKETDSTPRHLISSHPIEFNENDISFVRSATPKMHKGIIVADLLEDKDSVLKDVLMKYDIAVLSRLTVNPKSSKEGIGYIVLGYKKSGNPYNPQDMRILEIITNELVIATQNALRFEEIQKFNITLQEKVDEATRQLRRTNDKLRMLDETKDEFISMASHQLRTPLTSVKGYISMVLDGDAGKITAQQRKLLDQAFISSQRMVYLISDLLNVSRLRTGKFVIDRQPTNLAEVVAEEIDQLKETAAARELKLTFKKPKDFPELMLDETKIRQVIMNFIDNAIYYTPAGGSIEVALLDKPDSVEYRVKDTGIGVPKAERHKLFTKFYRAPNAKKARPDGTGLGLFMAKKVIVAQGGSVIFESRESSGSTFGFAFAKNRLEVPEISEKPQKT